MGKIVKGVNKINFTMLYGIYCYIFIENSPKKFCPCIKITTSLIGVGGVQLNNPKLLLGIDGYTLKFRRMIIKRFQEKI